MVNQGIRSLFMQLDGVKFPHSTHTAKPIEYGRPF
jgi:hypothetical protein